MKLRETPYALHIKAWANHLGYPDDIDEAMETEIIPGFECFSIAFNLLSSVPGLICDWERSGKAGNLLKFLNEHKITDLRTPPEQKISETIEDLEQEIQMFATCNWRKGLEREMALIIYDAIKKGEIKGIKIMEEQ